MKKFLFLLPLTAGLILGGCGDQGNNQVISKRYIHKYGYAVSEAEWGANNYPGQAVTTMRNGVTITATYENGLLHGPCTHTHPHSQTVESYYLYNFGDLKKEVNYDTLGMPIKENVQLSPHRHCITMWYGDGTPMSTEDFADDELLEGHYYTLSNDCEARVERGDGLRIRRDQNGVITSKDLIEKGYMTKRDTFYANGVLETTTHYDLNKKHGERFAFTTKGESLVVEEWIGDRLHGKSTYFNNGKKHVEAYYLYGARNGVETHFIDGDIIEQEIHWIHDRRHGPTKFYVGDAVAKTEWFYNGKHVSKKRFDELDQLDQMITRSATHFHDTSTTTR